MAKDIELTDEMPLEETGPNDEKIQDIIPVSGLYENYFLDYASYVILERAVPAIEDGLKPVQRRIMHSMKEMDDGRFNKVANVIGHTMSYHPHGDAAIGDAMVNLGQKELLIETQGNWGDIRTGDRAAAPRYIEARLSKFALEVSFNADTTVWQASYDGRKKEPVTLPMKFPLLLAQGVEGIAVGLATKIMPHNFCELIRASVDVLKGKPTMLLPDFPTGGYVDVTNYSQGQRGSKLRVRARIDVSADKKTLIVRDIPYGTTTTSVIESIVKASEANKIKIKKVIDNTAANVEIEVQLPSGVSPALTVDALYAFTDCEVSISPNTCVIIDEKPRFLGVDEILRISTEKTKELLKRELEIKLADLENKWFFSSLEKIFIENRIYRDIEECTTWESVIKTIDKGLEPFKQLLYRKVPVSAVAPNGIIQRDVTTDDIVRLTEIKIKRISKYDAFKADEYLKSLEQEIAQTENHLAYLTKYAIAYFENLLKKYGKGRERKTEIRTFDTIAAVKVAVANQKLYVDRKEGFVGYGLKKEEFVCDCSDLDDIIVFRRDGRFLVTRISEKTFVGKDVIHVGVFNKLDEHMVYNMIYTDGKSGQSYAKRFNVTSITRDKEYDLTQGNKNSRVVYFTANPNAESEVVQITLSPTCSARIKVFDFNFGELMIKGRSANGNIVTRYPIKKVVQKSVGDSTMGGRKIYLDETIGRLNTEKHGRYLGSFNTDDTILVLYKDGSYEQTTFDITNHYDMRNIDVLEKFDTDTVVNAVYMEGESKVYFVKRFRIETSTVGKRFSFISDSHGSKLVLATTAAKPAITLSFTKGKKTEREEVQIQLDEFIDVKGWKAIGNKLTPYKVLAVDPLMVEPEPVPEPVEEKPKPAADKTPKPEKKQQKFEEPTSIWATINVDDPEPAITLETKPAASSKAGRSPGKKAGSGGVNVGQVVDFEINEEDKKPKGKTKKQLNLF